MNEWTPEHDAQCDDAIQWHLQRQRERLAAEIEALRDDEARLAREMYPKNREAGVNHWGAARGLERALAAMRKPVDTR